MSIYVRSFFLITYEIVPMCLEASLSMQLLAMDANGQLVLLPLEPTMKRWEFHFLPWHMFNVCWLLRLTKFHVQSRIFAWNPSGIRPRRVFVTYSSCGWENMFDKLCGKTSIDKGKLIVSMRLMEVSESYWITKPQMVVEYEGSIPKDWPCFGSLMVDKLLFTWWFVFCACYFSIGWFNHQLVN